MLNSPLLSGGGKVVGPVLSRSICRLLCLACAFLFVFGAAQSASAVTCYVDGDGDGYGDPLNTVECAIDCTCQSGLVDNDFDCDDTDPNVNPGATEVCDGIDNDCNGSVDDGAGTTWYADADGDGYGDVSNTTVACSQPQGYVTNDNDCDDTDPNVNPGATEVCDDIDNDCNGSVDDGAGTTWYADADGDGYGDISNTTVACSQPQGYVTNDTDCDDSDPNVNPGATEVCDDIDNDCNGSVDDGAGDTWYADADGDGYGDVSNTTVACGQPQGYVTNDTDCDDTDPGINPGATEIENDGIDQDCNGADLVTCCDVVGDPNADGSVNIADAVYIINYIFNGGPGPICQ